MIIGSYRIELFIKESHSLKDKRKIVKSLIDRIRRKFNVAIQEVDKHNLINHAIIGIVTVGTNKKAVNSCLDKVYYLINDSHNLEIISAELEIY